MTKQEFMRANNVNQMSKMVQVLVGRLWDAAQAEGERVGYRKGVEASALKQADNYKRVYDEGVHDVKVQLSVSFPAALGKVLHRDLKFGSQRCLRVLDAIAEELRMMLDPSEAVEYCASFGLTIDWDDPLGAELDGWDRSRLPDRQKGE